MNSLESRYPRGAVVVRYLLRTLLFSAVGSVAYLAVFYLTFPSDNLRAKIMTEARKQHVDLRIGEVKPWGFNGLVFKGLSVGLMDKPARKARSRRKAAETDEEAAPTPPPAPVDNGKPPLLNLDRLELDVALLPLLGGADSRTLEVDVDAEAYGGDIEGSLAVNAAHRVVDLKGEALDLARYPIAGESFTVDAMGLASFDAQLDLSAEDVKQSSGSFDLGVQGLRILKSSKFGGMELPVEMLFTESVLRLEIAEGTANVAAMRFMGEAVSLEGDGEIFLNADLMRSRLKMKVRFKLGSDLEAFGALLPSRARSDDGYYHYMVTGLLSDPRFRPDTVSARKAGQSGGGAVSSRSPTSRPDTLPMPTGMDEDEEEMDNRPGSPIRKAEATRPGVSEEELEERRQERLRLAEERRKRREERLRRIREAQEMRGEDGEGVPPDPRAATAPFRPPFARGEMVRPPGFGSPDGQMPEGQEDEPPMPPEQNDDFVPPQELPEPEVEFIPEEPYQPEGQMIDEVPQDEGPPPEELPIEE